ncbi:ankyrin repeat domain-containing protein [Mesonia sp. K7]|uniref:ankyrin repeat domain-containing protein n=1 Tax=Mesonia sp. K7 TaxID=2218606 RepID=UPI000DA8C24F|nr:ankyrin repeat domain-containing protein [Mesonia sp. K7]PZD77403.1 ankyrin repeat domain-containing protein [Mesonia sp. K7]
MKKTILTVCLVFVATLTFANNYENLEDHNPKTEDLILKNVDLSSFCKAVIKGDVEMVKQLLQLGEDVNQKSMGKTPAMYAARYNKAEILEILIKEGADLSLKSDKERFTAKKFAELSNAKEALAIIVQHKKK